MADGETVHATLVAQGQAGVLLRGPSGSGKSDLALRLIGLGRSWRLVADDRVVLTREDTRVIGHAPAKLVGKLEARGVGIVSIETLPRAEIRLLVDLVARAKVPRMPEPDATQSLLGVRLPHGLLHAFEASCPDKVALLLALAQGAPHPHLR